ncbi:hypothetical protein BGZ80_001804 [Entomortierella chlamydospora]|uniref:Uncharacterized protein n=1 Tax=Entomortierella chlamydospora TaxID=101097 RepID=A0A9P6T3A4_9FUNG|nr:hypothetical protein BGZ79_004677 [Entomortierella chlamydospora]KAG0021738.1 hypothetical protein BGZ80_001804 [Entomortierella chlamydospora]
MGNSFSSHQSVKEEEKEWTAIRHQHQDKTPTIHHTHPQNTQQTVYHVPVQRSKIPFTQLVEEQHQEQQQRQQQQRQQYQQQEQRARVSRYYDDYEDDENDEPFIMSWDSYDRDDQVKVRHWDRYEDEDLGRWRLQKVNAVSQSPGRRKRGRKGRGDLYEDDFHAGYSKKEVREKCLERQATFQAKYLKAVETSKRLERSAK